MCSYGAKYNKNKNLKRKMALTIGEYNKDGGFITSPSVAEMGAVGDANQLHAYVTGATREEIEARARQIRDLQAQQAQIEEQITRLEELGQLEEELKAERTELAQIAAEIKTLTGEIQNITESTIGDVLAERRQALNELEVREQIAEQAILLTNDRISTMHHLLQESGLTAIQIREAKNTIAELEDARDQVLAELDEAHQNMAEAQEYLEFLESHVEDFFAIANANEPEGLLATWDNVAGHEPTHVQARLLNDLSANFKARGLAVPGALKGRFVDAGETKTARKGAEAKTDETADIADETTVVTEHLALDVPKLDLEDMAAIQREIDTSFAEYPDGMPQAVADKLASDLGMSLEALTANRPEFTILDGDDAPHELSAAEMAAQIQRSCHSFADSAFDDDIYHDKNPADNAANVKNAFEIASTPAPHIMAELDQGGPTIKTALTADGAQAGGSAEHHNERGLVQLANAFEKSDPAPNPFVNNGFA